MRLQFVGIDVRRHGLEIQNNSNSSYIFVDCFDQNT
jgi:hypothetical protein